MNKQRNAERIALVSMMMLMSACSVTTPVTLPNGVMGHEIRCHNMIACENVARQKCGGLDYAMFDKREEASLLEPGELVTIVVVECDPLLEEPTTPAPAPTPASLDEETNQ